MILVTGGAGYIGSHTVVNFLNHGIKDILIFDSLETGHIETVKELQKISSSVKFIQGDLKNIGDLENVFANNKIDAVIHFAAYSLVEESVVNPRKYYNNNVCGTLNLLNTMIDYDCKKIVFSSTCATYGEPEYTPIDEEHPQNPINPYGASKFMVERIMKDYGTAYGLKSILLRYFNVAGADSDTRIGEWHEPESHVIPRILKSALKADNSSFKIFGGDYETIDGTCIRDYVNVEDLAEAHYLAYSYLNTENRSEVFNVGTEQGDSVKKVFEVCQKVIGKEIPVEMAPRRSGDPAKLYANADKIKSILGWQPAHTLQESVSSAYMWEKKLDKMLDVTLIS